MYITKYCSLMAAIVFAVILSPSCHKKGINTFASHAAINFVAPSIEYSFLPNPANEYVLAIPVIIMGDSTGVDRQFAVEVVKDTNTTAADNMYQVVGTVVRAGRIIDTLRVKLLNAPELKTKKIAVKLKLVNGPDFKAGNVETNTVKITWSNQIVVPSWTVFRSYFTSVPSTAAYKLIVETTGLLTLTTQQHGLLGVAGAQALATKFGDYIKQWNLDHPNDHLKHDDGTKAGEEMVPLYYTHSKYN